MGALLSNQHASANLHKICPKSEFAYQSLLLRKAREFRDATEEMRSFTLAFAHHVVEETFWDSCGVADLITTCFGGRNRQCAEEFARTKEHWDSIEARLLGGQKLQGTLTAKDVYNFLLTRNMCELFPLMTAVYRISFENLDPINVVKIFTTDTPRAIKPPALVTASFPSKL